MYFYLNQYCILVSGVKKSAVYDFLNGKLFSINEENTKLLIESESGNPIDDVYDKTSVFKDLQREKLGFVSQTKCFVDKIRICDSMTVKRTDINHPKINTANIRLTNTCKGSCDICNKAFCPMCFTKEDKGEKKELDYNSWVEIINELCRAGLKALTFTGGDPLLYKDLNKLVDFTLSKGVYVTVVTPGIEPISEELSREVSIVVTAFKKRNFKEILNKFKDFKSVMVRYFNDDIEKEIKTFASEKITLNRAAFKENIVTKNTLNKFTLQSYSEKKYFNPCLIGKVFIDYDGSVVPCFNNVDKVLGSAIPLEFTETIRALIKDYWHNNEINKKCRGCEYKYACSSCRYSDTVKNCKYNPANGIWDK